MAPRIAPPLWAGRLFSPRRRHHSASEPKPVRHRREKQSRSSAVRTHRHGQSVAAQSGGEGVDGVRYRIFAVLSTTNPCGMRSETSSPCRPDPQPESEPNRRLDFIKSESEPFIAYRIPSLHQNRIPLSRNVGRALPFGALFSGAATVRFTCPFDLEKLMVEQAGILRWTVAVLRHGHNVALRNYKYLPSAVCSAGSLFIDAVIRSRQRFP